LEVTFLERKKERQGEKKKSKEEKPPPKVISPEDGICNICQNVDTPSTYDAA
jgi:hypothetical protein